MKKPVVLLIDDSKTWGRLVRHGLGPSLTMVRAPSFAEAERSLRNGHQLGAIIIGTFDRTAISFVRQRVASRFRGPMIAATSDHLDNTNLRAAGCTHIEPSKHGAIHRVRSICNGLTNVPAGSL